MEIKASKIFGKRLPADLRREEEAVEVADGEDEGEEVL